MICVDASLAAKWVLAEQDSERALYLYRDSRLAGVIAPPLLPVEVTNAIRRRIVRNQLSESEGHEALAAFLDFAVDLAAPSGLYDHALDLARRFGRPAVYDMHYVALAQIAGCDLWTADQRLLNALGGRLPFVRAISGFQPSV